MNRRVVITGLGLVCGVGNTAPEVWQNLVAVASSAARSHGFDTTGYPVTFACEVKNFDPLNFVDKKEARKMGRFIHFAFAATQEAIAQAGLQITPEIADRVGCFIGSGIGGFEIIEREHASLLQGGPRKISPFFIPAAIVNMAAGQLSIRYGARGPISATATACATSANSIGDSVRMILHGDADAMIAGGSEAGSALHVARTVCRRAERAMVALQADAAHAVEPDLIVYVNRLSDLLFVMARFVNLRAGASEIEW